MIDYNKIYLVSFSVACALKNWLQYSEETLYHYIDDGNGRRRSCSNDPFKSHFLKFFTNHLENIFWKSGMGDKNKLLIIIWMSIAYIINVIYE